MRNAWLPKVAIRNLFRYWKRSLTAIFSIAAGFAAINLFEGYIAGAEKLFDDTYSKRLMYGQILVHPLSGDWIEAAEQAEVAKILQGEPGYRESVRFLVLNGLVSNGATSSAFIGYGYDVAAGRRMRFPGWEWNTLMGKPLNAEGDPDAVVIGQGLSRLMDCNPLEKLAAVTVEGGYPSLERAFRCVSPNVQLSLSSRAGQANASSVSIQGIVDAVYSEVDSRYVAMPLKKAQALLDTSAISFYGVALQDPSRQGEFLARLREEFSRARLPLKATRWRDHPYGEIYVQSMKFLDVFRDFTLIVALTIVALSVFTLLTRLVKERTREIGTLRSLGIRDSAIQNLFLWEAASIAGAGNLIGAGMALALGQLLGHAGIYYKIGILAEEVPFRIALRAQDFGMSALILAVLAVGAAWIAIRAVLAKKIPDCLSGVEL